MKLILLCLVVAIVFAKPKGSIKLADPAKDVAQKETDKAVEEARHELKRMRLRRQRASSVLQTTEIVPDTRPPLA